MQSSPTQGCAMQLPRAGPDHTGSRHLDGEPTMNIWLKTLDEELLRRSRGGALPRRLPSVEGHYTHTTQCTFGCDRLHMTLP